MVPGVMAAELPTVLRWRCFQEMELSEKCRDLDADAGRVSPPVHHPCGIRVGKGGFCSACLGLLMLMSLIILSDSDPARESSASPVDGSVREMSAVHYYRCLPDQYLFALPAVISSCRKPGAGCSESWYCVFCDRFAAYIRCN